MRGDGRRERGRGLSVVSKGENAGTKGTNEQRRREKRSTGKG